MASGVDCSCTGVRRKELLSLDCECPTADERDVEPMRAVAQVSVDQDDEDPGGQVAQDWVEE